MIEQVGVSDFLNKTRPSLARVLINASKRGEMRAFLVSGKKFAKRKQEDGREWVILIQGKKDYEIIKSRVVKDEEFFEKMLISEDVAKNIADVIYPDLQENIENLRSENLLLHQKIGRPIKYGNNIAKEISEKHDSGQSIRNLASEYKMSTYTVQKLLRSVKHR